MENPMLDHLLEMPDDEPILWTECPNCMTQNQYDRCIPQYSCTHCEEIFKIPLIDTYEPWEFDYAY